MTVNASYYAGGTGYTPADMMQRESDWVSPGVLSSSDLVVAQTTTASMNVTVSGAAQGSVGGNAWLPNGYRVYNNTQATLTIQAADTTNPRIDLVVIGIDTTTNPYTPQLKVIKGTAAASPSVPALSTGFVGIALAQVRVNANATSITNANITDVRDIAGLVPQFGEDTIYSSLSDIMYKTVGGTATSITLTIKGTLVNGYPITFIASANNGGATTTINNKKLYKPATTSSPTLIAGKAYTVWYNSTGDNGNGCFFIKASAEGDADVSHVLAAKKFSNDNDTGLTGTMSNNAAVTKSLNAGETYTVPLGFHNGYGVVSASSLASQTVASATAAQILAGITAWVNGVKITGTATIESLGGKVYASGTVTSSSGTISVTTTGNYSVNRATVSITGLPFTPSRIKVKYAASADIVDVTEYDSAIVGNLTGALSSFLAQTSGSVSGNNIKQDTNVKVTSNGFVLPVNYSNVVYSWEAYK